MNSNPIDDTVRAFLRDHIHSYEHLEVLLLLWRSPENSWSCENVADRLSIGLGATQEALNDLTGQLLVRVDRDGTPTFRYSARTGSLDRCMQALAQAYETQLLELTKLMNANAVERIRSATARHFADSFLIGRGKRDG
ncbi:MAG TPA: hypothetical protein VI072_26935 [Polyangiaceae bacterium]